MKSEGDYEAARTLFETYGVHFDPALRDEVVARVDRLRLPSYTGFVMPTLDAGPRRDGRDCGRRDLVFLRSHHADARVFAPVTGSGTNRRKTMQKLLLVMALATAPAAAFAQGPAAVAAGAGDRHREDSRRRGHPQRRPHPRGACRKARSAAGHSRAGPPRAARPDPLRRARARRRRRHPRRGGLGAGAAGDHPRSRGPGAGPADRARRAGRGRRPVGSVGRACGGAGPPDLHLRRAGGADRGAARRTTARRPTRWPIPKPPR